MNLASIKTTRQDKNDAQITFRLPSQANAALAVAAQRQNRAPNWLVREIVLGWLAWHQRPRQ